MSVWCVWCEECVPFMPACMHVNTPLQCEVAPYGTAVDGIEVQLLLDDEVVRTTTTINGKYSFFDVIPKYQPPFALLWHPYNRYSVKIVNVLKPLFVGSENPVDL